MTHAKVRLAIGLSLAAALAASGARPPEAIAQASAPAHLADAPPTVRSRQSAYCDAQLAALKQTPALGDGQSDQAFMKTCLGDADPVAVLPSSAAVMNAPAGSTGVCKDGTYSSAVNSAGACDSHGGLARWFGR